MILFQYKEDKKMNLFNKKKTNYGKIIAISVAAVAAASAIAFVVYKLIKKYKDETVYDDLLEDCDLDCVCDCDCDCEDEAVEDAE